MAVAVCEGARAVWEFETLERVTEEEEEAEGAREGVMAGEALLRRGEAGGIGEKMGIRGVTGEAEDLGGEEEEGGGEVGMTP